MIPPRVLWDAARRGAGAFAVAALVGMVLAAMMLLAVPVSLGEALPSGGLWFLLFHHATVHVELPPPPGAAGTVLSFGAAPMSGTLLVGWLLFLAGRGAARQVRGSWLRVMGAGSLVAIPYAGLSLALALVIGGAPPAVPAAATSPGLDAVLRPSPWSALAWTLLLGVICGGLGGLASGPRPPEAPARAALAGGWRMAWTALVLSFSGLLVVAAIHPQATRAFFDRAFAGGPARGAAVLTATAMVVPNAASSLVAVAMGGSVRLDVVGTSCTLLSYARFPRAVPGPGGLVARACGPGFGGAPAGYLLFLLVPLASTALGGHHAARRAGVLTARRATALGAGAGAFGAALVTGLMVLARVTAEASGPLAALSGGGRSSLGPDLASGSALALLWGVGGGAVGGLLRATRKTGPGGPGPVGGTSDRSAYGAGGGAAGGGAAGGGAAGGGAAC